MAVLSCPAVLFGQADYNYNVGAYYYPWYVDGNFHGGAHATTRYHLDPQQQPALGWYDQNNASVISQHYKWAGSAGIDHFVCSYWGAGHYTDLTIRNKMFNNPDRGSIKLSAFLEPAITNANVYAQTDFLAKNYFNQGGYYKIDNKPVVYVYLTRTKSDTDLHDYVDKMRQASADNGYPNIYIVGDEVWKYPSNYTYMGSRLGGYLDAVTNYDVYGNIGDWGYVSTTRVDTWDARNDEWQAACDAIGVDFIPGVSPAYNDTAVRTGHSPISRKIDSESNEFGSLFEAQLIRAKDNTDEDIGRAIMVTSWNEWHEDTQIEPVSRGVTTNVDDSASGNYYTNDIYYESYGTRYLDILRAQTVPEPATLGLMFLGGLALLHRRRK